MSIDPINAAMAIRESYLSYLTTTFRFRDTALQEQFESGLRREADFIRGPILEATSPFETGFTIAGLIGEGTLSNRFTLLNTPLLPADRPLYRHQEQAIRKLVIGRRNVVVATGTGSGKTETFLIPILNYLFREEEERRLEPGVRALLLYPMNALANDQLVRLRSLLRNHSRITFGRYTGETEESHVVARERYRRTHGEEPLANELISREQMWESPPHILLTNYAMLEYLLLRPRDSVFFDGAYAQHWRFVVIDEAHTYAGAKGIEMAMLLRRLKDRVVAGREGRLQCIATSATLGVKEDACRIADFASQLFGESFEWVEDDPTRQDVVEAVRLPVARETAGWGKPSPEIYKIWQDIIAGASPVKATGEVIWELAKHGKEKGIPQTVLAEAAGKSSGARGWRAFLYELLKGDYRVLALQQELQEGPQDFWHLAGRIFPEAPKPQEALAALVDLANKVKADEESPPPLPARYHFFVRAIEGAYISLRPEKSLFLARRESQKVNDREYPVFEAATCRQCGATYLVGDLCRENGQSYLKQPGTRSGKIAYFLVLPEEIRADTPDEDDEVEFPQPRMPADTFESYLLCGSCGAVELEKAFEPPCRCGQENYHRLVRVPVTGEAKVFLCPACGKRSPQGMVWRFLVGTDAAASVLATALYQQIIPKKREVLEKARTVEDPWSSTSVNPGGERQAEILNGSRKLLVFSDSRQDAAFFAPYFNRTYNQIQCRNLILKVLQEHKHDVLPNRWRIQDLVDPLQELIRETGLLPGCSIQEQKNEAWKWVLHEFLALDRRISLEGLGLLGFVLAKPPAWRPPQPLMQAPWNLTETEVWLLFQVLLDTLRVKGAVLFPEHVSPRDAFFQPRNREFFFRAHGASPKKGIFSWNSPTLNGRLDFLIRLARNISPDIGEEECREVLKNIWERSLALEEAASCWRSYFSSDAFPGEGVVYRLRYNVWELKPTLVDESLVWYICDKCHTLTLHNIKGTCPTYRCSGRLHPCKPEELFQRNHYYRLYLNVLLLRMVAEEHTAQLTSETAAKLQNRFTAGEVNVLSCSTTFELGVDVGELEAVFMRNMPPSAANYIQRAGRAGRRTDAAAFALTFAQRRSHDLDHYREPWRMVSGKVQAPYFKIENEKIVRRHVYATALSAFWRCEEHHELFGKVENFFFKGERTGPDLFAAYLDSRPDGLLRSLKRFVPASLEKSLDLDGWDWVAGLFDPKDGLLRKAEEEVRSDVEQLEEVRQKLFKEGRRVDHLTRLIDTIKTKDLIGFLSSRNVIPKYGFPVDVVELRLQHHGEEARRLQLERDLRIALAEYAPSSQVVAGGRLWTSRYIKRLPRKEWERFRYAVCEQCQSVVRKLADLVSESEEAERFRCCPVCGQHYRNQGIFIVPAFGFIADRKGPSTPGEERPERTYATRVYFCGEADEEDGIEVPLQNVRLRAVPAARGKLLVINNAGLIGFKVCPCCGYTALGNERVQNPHPTPWGSDCSGALQGHLSLGHEFETDILKLTFDGYENADFGFWYSLLYALLEGMSKALDIERQDLDGCLYPASPNPAVRTLVLFDDVPGGAGHVRRVASPDSLLRVLKTSLARLMQCECGGPEGDASCYGCLRHYRNQFCHDLLKRGGVITFLRDVLHLCR
ncbi:MAG: DEAD/DEAH box helicase [Bacillota bacterium]|nr:DEAD/DEAH box helicase [Bacillota bacterium]